MAHKIKCNKCLMEFLAGRPKGSHCEASTYICPEIGCGRRFGEVETDPFPGSHRGKRFQMYVERRSMLR